MAEAGSVIRGSDKCPDDLMTETLTFLVIKDAVQMNLLPTHSSVAIVKGIFQSSFNFRVLSTHVPEPQARS